MLRIISIKILAVSHYQSIIRYLICFVINLLIIYNKTRHITICIIRPPLSNHKYKLSAQTDDECPLNVVVCGDH